MKSLAIEESAAEVLVNAADVPDAIWEHRPAFVPSLGIHIALQNTTLVVRGPKASAGGRFIIFPLDVSGFFGDVPIERRQTVIQRCLRAALAGMQPGMRLPPSWAPYSSGPYTIFYASTIEQGKRGTSSRAIVQRGIAGTPHVLVTEFIGDGHPINLEQYATPGIVQSALLAAATDLELPPESAPRATAISEFELTKADKLFGHGFQFSEWMNHLTTVQSRFVREPVARPTKLRGAAGTGKTLSLVLKALHDAYDSMGQAQPWQALILTHNWSATEALRSSLHRIDERNIADSEHAGGPRIDVHTLQTLAIDFLQLKTADVMPISEDGHDGKVMQLEVIESVMKEFQLTDWVIFRSRCSDDFRRRMGSPPGSADARKLAWDLMNEFACVISAERGLTKDGYVKMKRSRWMMSLPDAPDREVAFILHERFRHIMHAELGSLSLFDVINDLLRYLDSNTWDIRRRSGGYDLILVDEFHLFNKQEQLVFQYLNRLPNEMPKIVAALDPRQSPSETFIGVSAESEQRNGRMVLGGGVKPLTLELNTVFRYTREIHELIESLENFWVGFALGDEWDLPRRTAHDSGPKPELHSVPTLHKAIDAALKHVAALADSGKESAILCLSTETFTALLEHVNASVSKRCIAIRSRDDAEGLKNLGKRFVVSQPEYVAGLQFDAILVVDANEKLVSAGMDAQLQLRRMLSSLYLGVSRARRLLHIYTATDEGGLLRFLRPAVDINVLQKSPG